jgi:hypothetical protein
VITPGFAVAVVLSALLGAAAAIVIIGIVERRLRRRVE